VAFSASVCVSVSNGSSRLITFSPSEAPQTHSLRAIEHNQTTVEAKLDCIMELLEAADEGDEGDEGYHEGEGIDDDDGEYQEEPGDEDNEEEGVEEELAQQGDELQPLSIQGGRQVKCSGCGSLCLPGDGWLRHLRGRMHASS
jgi:hypothetical protein